MKYLCAGADHGKEYDQGNQPMTVVFPAGVTGDHVIFRLRAEPHAWALVVGGAMDNAAPVASF